jgi:signal transduction histidine kinase
LASFAVEGSGAAGADSQTRLQPRPRSDDRAMVFAESSAQKVNMAPETVATSAHPKSARALHDGDGSHAGDVVSAWRLAVLERSLWFGVVVVVTGSGVTLLQGHPVARVLAFWILPGLGMLVGAALWRTGPVWLRSCGLAGGFLSVMLASGLTLGLASPNPFVGAALLCVLSALVLGRRGAWGVWAISGLVWLVTGVLIVAGWELPPSRHADAHNLGNWFRVVSIYLTITAAATSAVLFMVNRLEDALRRGEALRRSVMVEAEQRLAAEREQRALEAQLQHSQKLEALGGLASAVAHDFNNLLTVIVGNAECAIKSDDLPDLRHKSMGDIVGAADRAMALVRQLLTFSHFQVPERSAIDVQRSVEASLNMLGRLLPKSITLRASIADPLPTIWAAPTVVDQILMNLVVNARDAMPDGGQLTVEAAVVHRATPGSTSEREFIRLRVSDTGIGMDEETRRHVFEPFFTTKPLGRGTGLGLSMVQSMAARCDGFVEVHSTHGMGTTFEVYLATANEEACHPTATVIRQDEAGLDAAHMAPPPWLAPQIVHRMR